MYYLLSLTIIAYRVSTLCSHSTLSMDAYISTSLDLSGDSGAESENVLSDTGPHKMGTSPYHRQSASFLEYLSLASGCQAKAKAVPSSSSQSDSCKTSKPVHSRSCC